MVIAMVGQETTQEFYTWTSLGTLAGAAGACVVVATVVGSVAGDATRKWAALVTSFAIMVVLTAQGEPQAMDWVVAGLNALLVFATATGVNSGVVTVTNGTRSRRKDEPGGTGAATEGDKGDHRLVAEWF